MNFILVTMCLLLTCSLQCFAGGPSDEPASNNIIYLELERAIRKMAPSPGAGDVGSQIDDPRREKLRAELENIFEKYESAIATCSTQVTAEDLRPKRVRVAGWPGAWASKDPNDQSVTDSDGRIIGLKSEIRERQIERFGNIPMDMEGRFVP